MYDSWPGGRWRFAAVRPDVLGVVCFGAGSSAHVASQLHGEL